MKPVVLRPDEHGAQRPIKVIAEQTGGAYSILDLRGTPGTSGPPPHVHANEEEAFYVISGEERFLLGDEEVTIGAGGFVLVPRGTIHTHHTAGTSESHVLVIFSPAGIEQFFLERMAMRSRGASEDEFAALRTRYGITNLPPR